MSTQDPPLFFGASFASLRRLLPARASQQCTGEDRRISLGSHLGETASPRLALPIKFPGPGPQWRQQTNHRAGRWGKGEPQAAPSLHLHCQGSPADGQEGFQLLPPPWTGVQLPLTKGSAPAGRGGWGQDAGLFLTDTSSSTRKTGAPGFRLPRAP